MKANLLSFSALALSATMSTVEAFWRMPTTSRITVERLDPLVFPGQIAPHVHTVVGASNFAETNTYENLRQSECTSALVSQDMSNYWAPQLYMELKDGSFESVGQTGGGFLIYYIQRRGDHNNETLYAFPEGFRMISGDPFLRSWSDTLEQRAINFVCLTYTTDLPSYYGYALPPQECPDGLRAQVVFPSCWDGKNLDSDDHKSHMAFPDGVSTGNCPATHPYRFITLFYEVTFNVADMDYSKAKNETQPFVFAMGDPTGYGFHGDFVNGWDVDVLQAAVDDCTDDSGVIEYCKHFDLQDYNHQCHKTPTVNEQTTGHLAKLPGNNPVYAGPDRAPYYTDDTSPETFEAVGYDGSVPPIDAQVLLTSPRTITASSGYNYTGCYAEPSTNNRALKQSLNSKISGSMTVDKCMTACRAAGYDYCGVEYGTECWGSTVIASGTEETSLGSCGKACKGDTTQYCGGSGAISIYKATSDKGMLKTNPGPAGSSFVGCYNEGSGSRALTGATYANSNMTVSSCVSYCKSKELLYAGLEYSRECYCGDSFKGNSTLQGTVSDPVSAGCTMSCGGNGTEYCGGSNRLNVYQISYDPEVVESSNGYKYDSCLSDGSSRSLKFSLNSKISGKQMTVDSCTSACRTAGYKYCGLEYGQECWGASQLTGSATTLDDSKCSMACKGDSRQFCGGNNALTFYTASDMTGITTLQTTSNGYKSQGCYTEGKNVRALATASFTSASDMTVDACTSYCSAKGFAYAGLEYARECYCASSIASSASVASPADNPYNAGCNMACTGNTSAYCGGSSRLNVYYNDALKQSSVAGVKSSSARQVGSSTAQATTSTAAARMAKRNAKHMDI